MINRDIVCQTCGAVRPRTEYRTEQINGKRKVIPKCTVCRASVDSLMYDSMTESDYNKLYAQQGGVCAICNFIPLSKPLVVDHDHATGKVRGLLCSNCNSGLGFFRDDPEYLEQAAEYLKNQ